MSELPVDQGELRRTMPGTDLRVHPLCLGTNVFGWTVERERAVALLDRYVDAGGNFLDTADQYPFWKTAHRAGESEEIIGGWMRARRNRDRMIVSSKVGLMPGNRGLSRRQIRAGIEGSLARLGTDVIDLYYAHFDDDSVPMEESLGAFNELVTEGKVRFLAASNFSGPRLAQALEISHREGLSFFVAVQERYNLIARDGFEHGPRPVVEANGMSALSYASLASGYLTGKYEQRDAPPPGGQKPFALEYESERARRIVSCVQKIATETAQSSASVALAWVIAQPPIVSAVASATSRRQLRDLLLGAELRLSAEELRELDAISRADEWES